MYRLKYLILIFISSIGVLAAVDGYIINTINQNFINRIILIICIALNFTFLIWWIKELIINNK